MTSVYTLPVGNTLDTHTALKARLPWGSYKDVSDIETCDVILAFCPVTSRVGTDIEAALREIPDGKPLVLVVLHQTLDSNFTVPDTKRFIKRSDAIAVDCLFNDDGLMQCPRNDKAVKVVTQFLQKHTKYSLIGRLSGAGFIVVLLCCILSRYIITPSEKPGIKNVCDNQEKDFEQLRAALIESLQRKMNTLEKGVQEKMDAALQKGVQDKSSLLETLVQETKHNSAKVIEEIISKYDTKIQVCEYLQGNMYEQINKKVQEILERDVKDKFKKIDDLHNLITEYKMDQERIRYIENQIKTNTAVLQNQIKTNTAALENQIKTNTAALSQVNKKMSDVDKQTKNTTSYLDTVLQEKITTLEKKYQKLWWFVLWILVILVGVSAAYIGYTLGCTLIPAKLPNAGITWLWPVIFSLSLATLAGSLVWYGISE